MVEELEVLWQKLSFTEEEDEGIELDTNSTKAAMELGKNCVVMKIVTHKSIIIKAMRKNVRMLWKPNKGVQISVVEEDMFLVEFEDGKDKKKVLDMWPWSNEKQLILMQEFEGKLTLKEIEMNWSPFWVQIFNLPLNCRTKEIGWPIRSKLGEVMEVDVDVSDVEVQWGRCLSIRVRLDVTKKLVQGKKITVEGGERKWVNLKENRADQQTRGFSGSGRGSSSKTDKHQAPPSNIANRKEWGFGKVRVEPISNTPSTLSLGHSSQQPRSPLQDISNEGVQLSKVKPKQIKIKIKQICKTKPITKEVFNLEASRKRSQLEETKLLVPKRRGVVCELENGILSNLKKNAYLERLPCHLGFDNLFIVPRRNLSGGLALLWMNELDLHIHTFSPRHIDAVVNPRIDDTWRFMGFYEALEVSNWEDSWTVLRHLGSHLDMPWNDVADWIKEEDRIGDLLVEYYSGLFSSSNPLLLDPVLNGVDPRVFPTMNDDLDRPFEASEVQCSKGHQSLSSERAVRWIPLIYPLYKVNFDGATFKKLGAAGLGAVVCDHTSSVLGALVERIHLPSSPIVVEALAYRRALYFVKELSIFEVSVEGDSEVIIKAIIARDMANPEVKEGLSFPKEFWNQWDFVDKKLPVYGPGPKICKAYTEKPNHISFSASKIFFDK
nr:hypothetical protein CFP56_25269 [Quercus suber]